MTKKTWTPIEEIFTGKFTEKSVNIRGWIYRTRSSGNIVFMTIRDATGTLQVTIKINNVGEHAFNDAKKALIESSLTITGTIKQDTRAPGGYELLATENQIITFADPFPITKDQSPEYLLDQRHLWLRSQKLTAIMKIRSTVVGAIHDFFRQQGFYEFDAPILQPNQCEGGSTLFEVKYYQDKTYLSQSWQLYAEAGIFSLEKIYNMGPTFRAERSKTSRHLSEFWMAEMEAAWMDLEDIIAIAKDEIRFILTQVLTCNTKELIYLNQDVEKLTRISKADYPVITYTEALEILKDKENLVVEWGKDLRTLEESTLMNHFESPLVVTNYPVDIMAFYKPRDPVHPDTALCFDMIAPGNYGEIIGGSQRSTDIAEMTKRLQDMGESIDNYQWYFDLRRYGSVPHSGYGLGVERVVAWICGTDNIKDTIPFPRTLLRFRP
ncbi:MAG: asparagine--tRNA ligase [Candidatus Thermoplasmatota archaeon]|nr:asparagine--tRNA ligase [Candidatus Thermoplasmatota archaeon]MBU1941624.1 asparagine--tRNA ligase [Candidatus Thermoplasmatota archaeon]